MKKYHSTLNTNWHETDMCEKLGCEKEEGAQLYLLRDQERLRMFIDKNLGIPYLIDTKIATKEAKK